MKRIELTGEWQLQRSATDETFAAPVPGDVHSTLLAAGRIPHPYWGQNELEVQWVGREDWIYSRHFTVPEDFLAERSVYLNCERLDTVAEIYVNDQLAAKTDNMFRRYRVDVKNLLQAGENELRIVLASAEKEAARRNAALAYPIPMVENVIQSPHINLLRKVACHGGWDWGICLMAAGIYGDISLHATSKGRIEYCYTEQTHRSDQVEVKVFTEFYALTAGEEIYQVKLGDQKLEKKVSLQPGLNILTAELIVENPRLWWPNGHGEQFLYPLRVEIAGDVEHKRIGLRDLRIVNQEDDKGFSFTVQVNGRDIFCKGANWIPCDALPANQTRERIDDLLESAARAHMNMIRVWGGGQYESDSFYELCDEKGLLIWHDLMFSCALYPATPDFLQDVQAEVTHQVKRLRDHPSIALWCGNNECLGALNWFEPSRQNRDRYLVDYDRLYEGAIGQAIDQADPTRLYWPSSPCGGRGDYSDCWHDDSRGDMHYWTVWHENASFEAYYSVVPRFCSEFGYQSFPSIDTIRSYASEDQFNVTSPVLEHHQRNPAGNSKIVEMMTRYFRMPVGFKNFVLLSQIQQAIAIKMGVEYWRHLRPTCMGTLYWQLNDNWPVCSWSSLEYGGKWKLLHYVARRFYAPVLGTIFRKDGGPVEVWFVNDRPEDVEVEAELSVWSIAGTKLAAYSINASIQPGSSLRAASFSVDDLKIKPDKMFLLLTGKAGNQEISNDYFFVPYKRLELPIPQIKVTVSPAEQGVRIELTSDQVALFVSLNVPGCRGEFSDNCFTMVPGIRKVIEFYPKGAGDQAKLKEALEISHLRSTY